MGAHAPRQGYGLVCVQRLNEDGIQRVQPLNVMNRVNNGTGLLYRFVDNNDHRDRIRPVMARVAKDCLHAVNYGYPSVVANGTTCQVTFNVVCHRILSYRALMLRTYTVVRVPFVNSIPIIDDVGDRFIFVSFMVFKDVLIRVVVEDISMVVGVLHVDTMRRLKVFFRHVIVRNDIQDVIRVVVPFIRPRAPDRVVVLPQRLNNGRRLVCVPPIRAKRTTLCVSLVEVRYSVRSFNTVTINSCFLLRERQDLMRVKARDVIVLRVSFPLRPIVPPMAIRGHRLVSFANHDVVRASLFRLTNARIRVGRVQCVKRVEEDPRSRAKGFLRAPVTCVGG